jgi:hypothetical protein
MARESRWVVGTALAACVLNRVTCEAGVGTERFALVVIGWMLTLYAGFFTLLLMKRMAIVCGKFSFRRGASAPAGAAGRGQLPSSVTFL